MNNILSEIFLKPAQLTRPHIHQTMLATANCMGVCESGVGCKGILDQEDL